jgi:predicted  nucleic acid-binding Zn-ribbon protein
VAEIRALRQRLEETAAKVTEDQEGQRRPRQQIGHALDELAKDDSRIGGQVTELLEQIEPAESRVDAATHALLTGAGATKGLRVGEVISDQDERLLEELQRAATELSQVRELVAGLRARLKRKQAERRDLRFQMAQLKEQLEGMNKSSTVDMEIWHEEAHRLSCQIQEKLEGIAPLAKRVSAHFGRYPELRDRVARGHAPITMS